MSNAIILHRTTSAKPNPIAAIPQYIARPKGTGKSEKVLSQKLERLRANLIKKMAQQKFTLVASSLHTEDLRDEYRCIHYLDYSVFYGESSGFCDMQPADVSYSPIEWLFPFIWDYMSNTTNDKHTLEMAEAFTFNDVVDPTNP